MPQMNFNPWMMNQMMPHSFAQNEPGAVYATNNHWN